MARDDFTKPVKVLAHQRVAGRCSNPQCRAPTFAPSGKTGVSNVGVGAHIHAASPGGPRYLATMTAQERRGFENIIWLCQTCSTIIDRDAIVYPAATLQNWKSSAEARALMEQGARPPDEKDIYRMAAMAMGNRPSGYYPEAIGNVHEALVNQLQSIDKRFTISTAYSNGKTSISVEAKEEVSFLIKIGPESAAAWRKGLEAALDEGSEATLPLDGVVFEGSELFTFLHNDADLGSLTIIPPSRPAMLKIVALQGASPIFESIEGYLTFGRKQIKFTGSGCGGLLEVEIIFTSTAEGGVHSISTLTTNVQAWHGRDAVNPPYLEAFIALLTALLDSSTSLDFSIEVEGNQVSAGKFYNPKKITAIQQTLTFARYVRRAKNVLRYIKKSALIDIFTKISADDHRTLAKISDIVEGKCTYKRSDFTGCPEMKISSTDGGHVLLDAARRREFSVMTYKEESSLIFIYGNQYEVPPTTTLYSPVRLHILDTTKKANTIEFRVGIEMAENFTSQTLFDLNNE